MVKEEFPMKSEIQHLEESNDEASDISKTEFENVFADTRPVSTRLWEIRHAYFYLLSIYASAIGIGIDSLLFNLLLGMPAFRKAYGYFDTTTQGWVIKAQYQSGWNGGSLGFQVIGLLFLGWYNDRYGRRTSLAISCFVTIIGNTIVICAPLHKPIALVMGKCVIGAGIGILVSTCPVYLSELMTPTLRGFGAIGINFSILFGQFLGSLIYMGCSKSYPGIDDHRSFKVAFGCQYILVGLYLLFVFFIPDSPIFLVRRGRFDEAKAALKKLYHSKNNTAYDVDLHYETLMKEVEQEREENNNSKEVSYLELLKLNNLRRLLLCIVCLTGQLWVGVAFTLIYVSYFFELAGVSSSIDKTVGMFTLCVGGNIFSYFIVEKFDRRVLYIGGASACTIMNLLVACMSFSKSKSAGLAMVSFIFIWAFVYQCTVGSLTYALITEIPLGRLRAKTVAVTSNVNSLISFGIGYLVPYLFNPDEVNMGAKIMFVWAGTGLVLVIVTFFWLPETIGRNANEVDQLFENKVGAWKFKRAKFDENDDLILSSVGKEPANA